MHKKNSKFLPRNFNFLCDTFDVQSPFCKILQYSCQHFPFSRHWTGICPTDILYKHDVKILVCSNWSVKRRFFVQMACGLQSCHNVYRRLYSPTTPTTALPRFASRLAWDRLLMNHQVFLLSYRLQLYTLIACTQGERAHPNGHGPDGSSNTWQVNNQPLNLPLAWLLDSSLVSICRKSLQPPNKFLFNHRLECRSRREVQSLSAVY